MTSPGASPPVLFDGDAGVLSTTDQLRLLLGERIPAGGTAADTFFSDAEINGLLTQSAYGLAGSALIGWIAKSAQYARLIDINESGGERKLSQRSKQAQTMVTYFQGIVDSQISVNTASGRVVGKTIKIVRNSRVGEVLFTTMYNRMPWADAC